MIVLCYGGGVDSTSILCGWLEKGLQESSPIDVIMFADTGGERPETYEYIQNLNPWLKDNGFPEITVVRKGGRQETLEEHCLRTETLPALAYGRRGCSHKFKIEPQETYLNHHPMARAVWKKKYGVPITDKVTKLLGLEFNETRRWSNAKLEDERYVYRFPLVEWEWVREDCKAAILRAGLTIPGKSSCFFCPASTKSEILELKQVHPDLFERAIKMEDAAQAKLKTVKGLGRKFSWRDFASTEEEAEVVPCMACVD